MSDLLKTEQEDGKTTYLLKRGPGTDTEYNEITEWQYNAINSAMVHSTESVSGSLSETDILRLHREQDPASPLYKGSEPTDGGSSVDATGESESAVGYYEPTADNLDSVADQIPAPQGSTSFSTEEVSKPYEEDELESTEPFQGQTPPSENLIATTADEPIPEVVTPEPAPEKVTPEDSTEVVSGEDEAKPTKKKGK